MRALLALVFLFLSSTTGPAWAGADARVALVERNALLAADRRCGLFGPEMRAALQASALQARGAVLRAGETSAQVDALIAAAVAEANGLDCRAPKITAAARRARDAFAGYSKTGVLTFPGRFAGWTADRTAASGWALRQSGAGFAIGAPAEAGSAFSADIAPRAGSEPVAARLVMRDRAKSPTLVTSAAVRLGARAGELSDFGPPVGASRALLAARRQWRTPSAREADRGVAPVWRFAFADAALSDLAALDPREAAILEIDWTNGARTRHFIEIGDLGAAVAFLRVPRAL